MEAELIEAAGLATLAAASALAAILNGSTWQALIATGIFTIAGFTGIARIFL